MSLINDMITYFAQFPLKAGVLKNFNRKVSELPEYEALKTQLTNLDPHSLLPDIKDFVIGVNEGVVAKTIGDIKDIYLFVDYGSIDVDRDDLYRENGTFNIAVTVAVPYFKNELDCMEDMILAERTLKLMQDIRNKMIADQKQQCPYVKNISFPHEITPWYSREFHNSTGWTMVFQKTGIELI